LAPPTGPRPGIPGRQQRPAAPEDLRRNNLADLVRHLHAEGPLSRSELTARTGLNRSTVGDLVGALAAADLVSETAPASRAGAGRPSHVVRLCTERIWALAVEMAAGSVVVARVGPGGRVQARLAEPRHHRTGLPPAEAVSTISRLAAVLVSQAGPGDRLVGTAVAVPGIVRREDGFVHLAPNLAWHNVPLASLLANALPTPGGVLVANEADLGALAERARGAALGCRHVVYISGNAGVGAGIVVDGALLAGRSGYAGEVGHMKVNPNGARCRCGGHGCWESEIGAAAILRRAGRRATDAGAGVASVLADALAGQARAGRAVAETGRWVGRGTANLINIFNPDIVVFGGGLRSVFLAAEPVIRDEIRHQALPQAGQETALAVAGLGTDSALVGAAELAFSDFLADPLGRGSSADAEDVVEG
jgi:predicted NBD/HSP70 family sugar kinase